MELASNDHLRVRRINVEPSARLFRYRKPSVSSIRPGDRVMAPLTEFHATMADVTNNQHENMAGLVQDDDFNADVVVRFLRDNGIDATVDEPTGGFRYTAADPTHASHVRFRLRLPARIVKLRDRGRLLVHQGEAMMPKHWRSPHPSRCDGHRRDAPV
jgi:hypothetical protein